MKQTEIEKRFKSIEERLKILESLHNEKKDKAKSSNESYLGTRSETEEGNKSGHMSTGIDRKPNSDIKKRGRPKK